MDSIQFCNIQDQGTVHTPLLVIRGRSTYSHSGVLVVSHQTNAFPPLYFEVNHQYFKAVIHLDDGPNSLIFTHSCGIIVDGFPQFDKIPSFTPGTVALTVNYEPLRNNLPVHLCVLLAKDSPALFDSPAQKMASEGNGLDVALKKLRIGGRLMQAFTNEQMLRAGFGNRTFSFYEEPSFDSEFCQESSSPKLRQNIKIHVLKSDKSLKELRDPNLAQQNPNGRNTNGLFMIAKDALIKYGLPFNTGQPVQAAVMFLDTHWDNNLKLILTHAALAASFGNIKLAIFGSHGLYSWPSYLEQVVPCFQDITEANINEVANDSNLCPSYWRCLNVTLGSFMDRIASSLLCLPQNRPRINFGILHRTFVIREAKNAFYPGFSPVLGIYYERAWDRSYLMCFLYHPSFQLPQNIQDPSFGRLEYRDESSASIYPVGNDEALIKSSSGIYGIEVWTDDPTNFFTVEYLPLSLGGRGVQFEVTVNSHVLKRGLRDAKDFHINVLYVGGQIEMHDVIKQLSSPTWFVSIPSEKVNRQGDLTGVKTSLLGSYNTFQRGSAVFFDSKTLRNIRVYHGAALDGMRFDYVKTNSAENSLIGPFENMSIEEQELKNQNAKEPSKLEYKTENISVLFGNQTNNFTDFAFGNDEHLQCFNLRTGAWVDCIQIGTSLNRSSGKFGNSTGGSPGKLEPPNQADFEIVGVWGTLDHWVYSIGIIYAPKR